MVRVRRRACTSLSDDINNALSTVQKTTDTFIRQEVHCGTMIYVPRNSSGSQRDERHVANVT